MFVHLNVCVLPTGGGVIGSPEIKRNKETRCLKMTHRAEGCLVTPLYLYPPAAAKVSLSMNLMDSPF